MFSALKKIFSTTEIIQNKTAVISSEAQSNLPKNPHHVTETSLIAKILREIAADINLCTIEIEAFNEKFTSTILQVKQEQGLFVLDELTPFHGNDFLIAKNGFKLTTRLRGMHVTFEAENIDQGILNNIAFYNVDLPKKVYYPQRRVAPRLPFVSLKIPFHAVSEKNDRTITGEVCDISRGGIGITLADNRARVQRGEILTNCRIKLPNSLEVNFDLTVRSVKPNVRNRPKIQIGGHFSSLPSKISKKLDYFLASLEREEIRNRKN